jgi:hypothetical protein
MTSGRVFVDKKLGKKVKRAKSEKGEGFCKAIFSFSPLRLVAFFPLGNGRKKARVPGTLAWN